MTVQNPPIWLQTGSHTAEQVRRWAEATLGTNEGVMGGDELAVTHSSAMTLSIAEGRVLISGTENSYQGTYFCENRGAATVTVTGGDATNPRIDLVVARVRDSVYSGSAGNDGFTLEVVTGTAAASPSAPTLPDNCVALAEVAVAAGASSLTGSNLTDVRKVARKPGLQVFASSSARTTQYPSPLVGDITYLTDVARFEWWDGTAYQRLAPIITVSTSSPSGGENGDVWVQVI